MSYAFNEYYAGTYELMHWQRYLDMSGWGQKEPRDILSICYLCGRNTSNVLTKVHEFKAYGFLFCCSEECFMMWLLR